MQDKCLMQKSGETSVKSQLSPYATVYQQLKDRGESVKAISGILFTICEGFT